MLVRQEIDMGQVCIALADSKRLSLSSVICR